MGVRHGEVDNPANVVYARLPGFHLSAGGLAAARQVGETLSGVAAVYSSPLERAAETAEALAAPHGLAVVVDDRLVEWSFWDRWQGLPWAEVPESVLEILSTGGPSEDPLEAVGQGVLAWASDACAQHRDGVVLGVSHEAPLAAAGLLAAGEPMAGFRAVSVPHLHAVRFVPGPPRVTPLCGMMEVNGRTIGDE